MTKPPNFRTTDESIARAALAHGSRSIAKPSSPSPHDEEAGRGAALCSPSHGPLCKVFSAVVAAVLLASCQQQDRPPASQSALRKHEHVPPHHGTPVVLGNEEYHVEFVLDAPAGKLQAYVLDGELEKFIRVQQPAFEVAAQLPDRQLSLAFVAVANNATGETVGDTSLFEAQADWLRSATNFDAVLKDLLVRSNRYQNVAFNFPKGNDVDEKGKL